MTDILRVHSSVLQQDRSVRALDSRERLLDLEGKERKRRVAKFSYRDSDIWKTKEAITQSSLRKVPFIVSRIKIDALRAQAHLDFVCSSGSICQLAEASSSRYYRRREVRAKLGPSICHSLASKRVYERDSAVAYLT